METTAAAIWTWIGVVLAVVVALAVFLYFLRCVLTRSVGTVCEFRFKFRVFMFRRNMLTVSIV